MNLSSQAITTAGGRAFCWVVLALLMVPGVLACQPAAPAAPAATPRAAAPAASGAAPQAAPQAAAPAAPAAAPDPVSVGTHRGISDAALLIAQERGYFAEEGLAVDLVPLGAAEAAVLLSTGQMDVAGTSVTSGLINAINRGVPVKIVADKASSPPGGGYMSLVLRKPLFDNGTVRNLSDLAGRRIALISPDLGSPNGIELLTALNRGGLTVDQVDLLAMPFPDINVALANGSIDAAIQSEPFVALGVEQGILHRWIGNDELVPGHQNVVTLFSPDFANNRTAVANRWMTAYVRATRDYHRAFVRGEGREEIVALLSRATTVTNPALYDKMVMPGMHPDALVDRGSIERDQSIMLSLGRIQAPVDLDTVIDNRFIEYALSRLGRQ